MDFFTVPTLYFKVLYVFILISHDRRKIEHIAVTTNPSSAWVAQQIREATPFGNTPKYLIHDNDSIFTSKELCKFLENANVKAKKQDLNVLGKMAYVKEQLVFCAMNCLIISSL